MATSITIIAIFLAYRQALTDNPFEIYSDQKITPKYLSFGFSWLNDYSNERYFLVPFIFLADISKQFEKLFVDAFVNLIAKGSVVIAHLLSWGDKNIVDGGVKLTIYSIRSAGQAVRGLQNGKIQSYFLVTFVGVFLLILWLVVL